MIITHSYFPLVTACDAAPAIAGRKTTLAASVPEAKSLRSSAAMMIPKAQPAEYEAGANTRVQSRHN
jgi:hypothetical protein